MAEEIQLHRYVERMEGLIDESRFEEIIAHGRHILQHYPKHLDTYRVLGKAMLEAGQEEYAEDMFKRVLSGDPEDYVARVGMSIICDRQRELEGALWHVERAFELAPDNEAIRGEVRRLYGRRDGVEPGRLGLTRAALARVHARGALYSRAIEEFEELLEEDPQRVDLLVALAEALWRNEERAQAEEVCLRILDELPFCLKANLILGEIYTRAGRVEGQTHLQRAEALDPENSLGVDLLGDDSSLSHRVVRIPDLEYTPSEERPEWMPFVEAAPVPEERAPADVTEALETQIEIPAWLEEVALGREEPLAEEGEEIPARLVEQPVPEAEPERPGPAEELPEWLQETELVEELEEAIAEGAPPIPAEIPDWLTELAPEEGKEEVSLEEEPPTPEAREEALLHEEEIPSEIPSWLEEPVAPEAEERVPADEELAAPPSWLETDELPSGDEALAWLESLAEGKEEELRAAAEAEAEARLAEIMGAEERPPEEEVPEEPTPAVEIPEFLEEAAPLEGVEPAPEAEAPLPEIPEWLAEARPPAEEAPPQPEIEEAEEIAAADVEEAFGWTAFDEEEPPAERREAPVAGAPVEEEDELPEEAEPVPEAEAPVPEIAEWLAELRPPEEEPTPTPELEEEVAAAEVVEEPIPAPAVEEVPEEEELVAEREDLAVLREQVDDDPRDYEAWLELARGLWEESVYDESLEAYSRAMRSRKLLEDVVTDMEGHLKEHPSDPMVQRVLGEAYMRSDQLERALDLYRDALGSL